MEKLELYLEDDNDELNSFSVNKKRKNGQTFSNQKIDTIQNKAL